MRNRNEINQRLVIGLTLAAVLCGCGPEARRPLLVMAAASLGGPLDSIVEMYRAQSSVEARIAYGASGTLAQQIRGGAPADLFISADPAWIQRLSEEEGGRVASWTPFLRNRLVLATGLNLDVIMRDFGELDSPSIVRIAIADPQSAPAGQYARAYMERTGVWNQIQGKLVIREDARGVVNALRLHLADIGFVYSTDVTHANGLFLIRDLPDSLCPPIVYALAIIGRDGGTDRARRFVDFLHSQSSQAALEDAGFSLDPEFLKQP